MRHYAEDLARQAVISALIHHGILGKISFNTFFFLISIDYILNRFDHGDAHKDTST